MQRNHAPNGGQKRASTAQLPTGAMAVLGNDAASTTKDGPREQHWRALRIRMEGATALGITGQYDQHRNFGYGCTPLPTASQTRKNIILPIQDQQ